MNLFLEQLYDETRSAWRFRWIGLIVAAVVALIGWCIVFTLEDRYEARASIFVDTSTALKPVLQGLTVEQDVNTQLNYVRQSLLTGSQLEQIARDAGVLTLRVVDPREVASILDAFAKRIVLEVTNANSGANETAAGGTVYSFTYQDSNRIRSLMGTETILNRFVESTLGGKRTGSENAQKFLETQIKRYEDRLRLAENKLAEFKKANIGLMPTEQGGYFAQLQTEIDLSRKTENDLNVAVSRRAELTRQLRGETAIGAVSVGPALPGGFTAGGGDTVSRIKETQARLDDLMLRFTDRHPDVVAARATLVELNTRRANEIESLRRGDAGAVAASGISSNPVYQSIQLQLNQAEVEIASLRGQLGQHRAKAGELRQRLDTAPKVEAEFAQLNRDYDINRAQYTALLGNYEKAQLGERADNAGSVTFEIVQPPTAPFGPVSPPRILMLIAILLGSLGLGGGLAYLLHILSPVVGSLRGLSDLTDLPILGVVSPAFPEQHRKSMLGDLRIFGVAAGGLFCVFIIVMILNYLGWRLPVRFGGVT